MPIITPGLRIEKPPRPRPSPDGDGCYQFKEREGQLSGGEGIICFARRRVLRQAECGFLAGESS